MIFVQGLPDYAELSISVRLEEPLQVQCLKGSVYLFCISVLITNKYVAVTLL